jgi:hypothetical protein
MAPSQRILRIAGTELGAELDVTCTRKGGRHLECPASLSNLPAWQEKSRPGTNVLIGSFHAVYVVQESLRCVVQRPMTKIVAP